MYLSDYIWFLGAILFCMLFAGFASYKVNSTYAKYDRYQTKANYTGYQAASRLLRENGVSNVGIGKIPGKLTDHYHPTHSMVNLSQSTCDNNSISAVAVAAHEIGHVMQKQNGYLFYKIRTALVPVVNFGTRMAMPLVLVGLLIDLLATSASNNVGFYIAMVGVIFYGGSLLFALITLPVELNASKRAKQMLLQSGILTQDEIPAASQVLSAASLTYLASLLTSLVYFLRFLVYVLTMFGRRNNDR